MRWRWTVIGTATGAAAALAVWALGLEPWLELDRSAIADGQAWRMLTAHWTHFGFEHLAWDVAVFIVLGVLAETRSRAAFLACLAGAATATSLAVLFEQPGLQTYRGLSGIDSALFAFVVTTLARDAWTADRRRLAGVAAAMGVLFAGKTAWEAIVGDTLFVDAAEAGFVAVPLAHLVGAAVGVVVAAAEPIKPLRRWRQAARSARSARPCPAR